MELVISFPYNSFNQVTEAFNFIINYINFKPAGILSYQHNGYIEFDIPKIVKYIDEYKLHNFHIISKHSSDLDFGKSIVYRNEAYKRMHIFIININAKSDVKMEELIHDSANIGFSMIIYFDLEKAHWQNEMDISKFKLLNQKYKHLPTKWDEKWSPILGRVIDIAKNPGHWVETYSTVLMAAPEIWFGPSSWEYFDKDKLLKYKKAIKIKELDVNVIYVNLFDPEVPNYEQRKILKKQKRFRKWVQMDKIEEKLNGMILKGKPLILNNIH